MTALVITLLALALILATSLVTYEVLSVAWRFMRESQARRPRVLYALGAAFVSHFVAISLYAVIYYLLSLGGGFGSLHEAVGETGDVSILLSFYYSAATYSTIGFGDVIPTGGLRAISVVEGLNGLLLIGWSVAHSFLAMEEFWDKPQSRGGLR